MSRPYCEICALPSRTCICALASHVGKIQYQGEIHVIQHPSETGHAKNSVRLVKLIMPTLSVWQGETPEQLTELRQQIIKNPQSWGCFYPCAQSIESSSGAPTLPHTKLLFIDATWRKARKIWHLNPWLQALPLYHLPKTLQGQYSIRKNHAEHQLSTLEAIAYAIHHCADNSSLLELFDKFQDKTKQYVKNSTAEK